MIVKNYLLLAMLMTVAGCGSAPVAPEIVQTPIAVDVPVGVPCKIDTPAPPAWALSAVSPAADVYTKVDAALAELLQRAAYEGQLLAAIASCQ